MRGLLWLNAAAAALSLAASAALALWLGGEPLARALPPGPTRVADAQHSLDAQGRPGLLDAGGHFTPLGEYRRIVSLSSVADNLLLELCEPARVAAFSSYAARASDAHRYAGLPQLRAGVDPEELLALGPDLVLANGIGDLWRIELLRRAGLPVFDLGEMRGRATLAPNLRALGALLGAPERALALARRFESRLDALARHVPQARRPRGIYLAVYGDSLLGGSRGSSYADVLAAAGVRDAAAERYAGWPRYGPEALLELDPELIVTHRGMTAAICRYPGLARLRACGAGGRIAEVDGALLGEPTLRMLEAAESVFDAVHGTAG